MESAFQFHVDRIPCTVLAVSVPQLFASRDQFATSSPDAIAVDVGSLLTTRHEAHLFSDLSSDSNNIANDNKERWVGFEYVFYFLGRLCKTEVERRSKDGTALRKQIDKTVGLH